MRSWMAVVASLLSGSAVLVVGGSHLAELPRGATFLRDAWLTLGIAIVCANAVALAVVITTTRGFEHMVAEELRSSIDKVRGQLQQSLAIVSMESDRNRAIIDTVFASVFAVDSGGRIISANPDRKSVV